MEIGCALAVHPLAEALIKKSDVSVIDAVVIAEVPGAIVADGTLEDQV